MFAIDTSDTPVRRSGPIEAFSANPAGWLIGVARRHALTILACGLIGLAVGAALALLTPNRYHATTQLLIDPRDFRVLSSEISPQAVNSDAVVAYLESQVRVMTSDSVKRKVVERLRLAGDPDFGGASGGGLLSRIGFGAARPGEAQDQVLRALAAMDKQVMIRRGERTFVIDITTITGDGAKSARVSNAIAETYLEDQTEFRAEAAQRASNSLGSRLAELRERLRATEDKVEKYRAANNLVGASGKLVSDEQLSISNAQLSQARARVADAQAKFDQIRAVRPQSIEAGAVPEALQSQAIANLRAQFGAAQAREADARVLYGPQHPQFVSAQEQVRDARRQIAEELARIVQGARAELDRARSAETTLNQSVERLKRESLSSSQAAVQLRELEREADANRQVYQAFLLRARETGELTNVDSTNARVITTAVAPLEKAGPNRKLFAITGLIAGLGLGVAFALLRELSRGAARAGAPGTPDEASIAAGSALRDGATARTPTAEPTKTVDGEPGRAAPSALRFGRWRQAPGEDEPRGARGRIATIRLPDGRAAAGRFARQQPAGGSAFHGAAFPTASWDDARSPFAAAIQSVRDRLVMEETAAGNRKVVVLGLQPAAGVSSVALNLALAGAREKAVPLLVDLGGGPASLGAVFGEGATLGAEDVVSGRAGLIRAALQDEETGVFFLPRLPAGERMPAPCPSRLKAGLFDQTRRFETVIVDAGAVSDGALPHLLAELADDIAIVARGSMEIAEAERLARRALGADAGKIRALILNDAAR